MDCRDWLCADGFLSFYHKNHERHGDDFADSCHNTGLWMMGEYINGTMSKQEMRSILKRGMESRWDGSTGHFIRYPGSDEVLNRDQCMFLVPLLFEADLPALALHLIQWHWGIMMPHWRDYIYNEQSWLGDRAECIDALMDRWGKHETSIIKNIGRLCWNEFKGAEKNRSAWYHISKAYYGDPLRAVVVFGSRRPETHEDDYPNLPPTPSINTPPPIYQPWLSVVPKYALAL